MGIVFKAPIRGSAGYPVAARNLILAFSEIYKDIQIHELGWVTPFYAGLNNQEIVRLNSLQKNILKESESTLVHITTGNEFIGRENFKKAFGFTLFETNSLPKSWVQCCNKMDGIIACSKFNVETFTHAGVKVPIEYVPLGVDTDFFRPNLPPLENIPKKFTFLSIAQLSARKGAELVLRAFFETLANKKDTQLILRWYFKDSSSDEMIRIRDTITNIRKNVGIYHGDVYIISPVHFSLLNRLYNSVNVLVSPFRGEAWGLPIIEALSCEVPVIVTGWGGVTDFVKPEFGTLLNYKLVKVPENHTGWTQVAHIEGHYWAEPDYNHLKEAMLDCYYNYSYYKSKAIKGRIFLKENFTWKHSAEKLKKVLKV